MKESRDVEEYTLCMSRNHKTRTCTATTIYYLILVLNGRSRLPLQTEPANFYGMRDQISGLMNLRTYNNNQRSTITM